MRGFFEGQRQVYCLPVAHKMVPWGMGWGGGCWELLGLIFAGYVLLASQQPPTPLYVYSTVANYRPHLSHFWANM